jgi:hypothetical protein
MKPKGNNSMTSKHYKAFIRGSLGPIPKNSEINIRRTLFENKFPVRANNLTTLLQAQTNHNPNKNICLSHSPKINIEKHLYPSKTTLTFSKAFTQDYKLPNLR